MKKDVDREEQREDIADDHKVTEQKARQTPPCNEPLARAAYEWDHALKIATDRFWSEQGTLTRKVPRKPG